MERQRDKDQLETLKLENAKKARKLKKLKLQTLKLQEQDKIIKNTLKKYNKPKPKPKKKSIWDAINLPIRFGGCMILLLIKIVIIIYYLL